MKQKTGVLLINLGTPDSPKTKDVRRYLSEFLNDPRVIDIHPWLRFFLVNCIIVPFNSPISPPPPPFINGPGYSFSIL